MEMKQSEIIAEVKRLFGKNRSVLLEALVERGATISHCDKIEKRIKKTTGQPVVSYCGLSDETLEWMKLPKKDRHKKKNLLKKHDQIGDVCCKTLVLLNDGIKKGYDWDRKLALKCGGRAFIVEMWSSLLLPVYTFDIFFMEYSRKMNYFEFGPYKPQTESEKRILKSMRSTMKNKGFIFMSKEQASRKAQNVQTDCKDPGDVTIFDCLFSDVQYYDESIVRFSDKEIQDNIEGVTVSWREYYNNKHKLIEKEIHRFFPSGDVESTYLDKKGHITRIEVMRKTGYAKHSDFILDIDKRMKQRKQRKKN